MASETLSLQMIISLITFGISIQTWNVSGMMCGRVNISRPLIQDGNPALRGEWPFIAALYKVNGSRFFCGGTIITNKHVLTAAHCIQQKFSSHRLSPSNITVRLGAHNLTNKIESGMVQRNVVGIVIHPQWNPYIVEYDADIAVLELNETVAFTIYIQPIRMPVNVAIDGVECSIVGWGISNKGTIEETPQYTVTRILNDSYCYKQDPPIIAYTSSNTFCGGEGDGVPNKGDSGGGIFAVDNFSWVQYGIISAVRTNETGHVMRSSFAVYTNINMFRNWIIDIAKMNDEMNITLTCHFGPMWYLAKYKCFLYDLDIRGNNTEIASFSDSHLAGKTNLDVEEVHFHNGTMLFLPNGVGKFFKNLKRLSVGFSYSSYLGMKAIKRLNFKDLENVEQLVFYRNDVTDLAEDSFWDLPNLTEFRLVHNKLKTVHERTFEKNFKLKKIRMSSNEIDCIPRHLFKNNLMLETVYLDSNSLKTIDEKTFQFNEKLQALNLASNQLKTLPANLFINNLLINYIVLRNNYVATIDENIFQNNVKLLSLDLESNQLEFLPKNLFKNNPALYAIDFDSNLLKIVDTDFTEIKTFWHIDFRKNSCILSAFYVTRTRRQHKYMLRENKTFLCFVSDSSSI